MAKHEYKVGDFVEIVTLYPEAVYEGLRVGQVHPVLNLDEDGNVYVKVDGYAKCWLSNHRVKPFKPEPLLFYRKPEPTEREQRIREMAHKYYLTGMHTIDEAIRAATDIYDTPIPPPSKP